MPPIEVDGAVVFGLPASDVQLVALNGDVETVFVESGYGEADAQPIIHHLHDIVRRIAPRSKSASAGRPLLPSDRSRAEGDC